MADGGIVTVVVTATGDGEGTAEVFASAVDALRSAVESQRATPARIGVHVGEGSPTEVAQQLCATAISGQILVSDLVHALVGTRDEFAFRPAGTAWEVAWQRSGVAGLPLPAALGVGERLPFVGRTAQLGDLQAQWDKAKAGQRALVMLAGEPGIGKTRLAAEFARKAHDDGATVTFGHADEETLLPYQPFVEALQHILRSVPADELRELVGDNGAELARLLPSLRDFVADLPAPIHADADSERYRLFEAVIDFLTALSARGPMVLILDDLHWADKPSLLLLHHLFRASAEFGMLVIATYRDTDLDRRHPLADTLADLRRLVQFERLAVTGLAEDDLQQFLVLLSGQEPPKELARSLLVQTEGNPFYLSEVLRNFVESGAVGMVDGEWVTKSGVENLGIPEGVKEVIGRRVSRLSDDANIALAVAAIAGREFDLDVVARVTEVDQDRLLAALEEAVGARLVIELPGPPPRFRFAHALVRETLYDELTTARRVRLHRRIAQTIEELHGGDVDPPLAQLAFHYAEAAQGGDVAKSVDYARRAGAKALEQLAYEEAASHFDRAMQVLDLSEDDERLVRGEVLVQRGRAREAAGDLTGAKADFAAAAELGRELAAPDLLARAALGWAGPFTTGAMNLEIVGLLEAALALLPDSDSSARAEVLCRLSFELYWGGDHARMQDMARQGIEMARRLDDPHVLGSGLNVAALLYDDISQAEERLELMQEAIRMADAVRDGAVAHLARSFASWAQLELGDRAGYDRTMAEGTARAREMRLPRMRWYVPLWETVIALIEGDMALAERLAYETLALGQAADDFASVQIFGAQMFSIRREQGRLDEFDSLVRSMVVDFPAVPTWKAALTLLLAELDNPDEARAYLDIVAADDLSAIPRDNAWAAGVALIGEAAFLLDAVEASGSVFTLLSPFEDRFVAVGQAECFGSIARFLGQAAATCGRLDEAVAHFERGIAADLGMGGVRMAIRGRCGLARTLLARGGPGDREQAAALIAQSREPADRLGLVRLSERLRALEA